MATRLSFSPAEKLSARSPRDGPRSARLQSRTPAKDKPGRQSFRESPGAFRAAVRLAEPTEPQTPPPAGASGEPAEAEMSARAAEAKAQAAEISRHKEQVRTAAQKWPLWWRHSSASSGRPAGCLLSTRSRSQPSRSDLQLRIAPPAAQRLSLPFSAHGGGSKARQ